MNLPADARPDQLLSQILASDPPPFAVLFRPSAPGHHPGHHAGGEPGVRPEAELLVGDVAELPALADLPIGRADSAPVLAVVPFRQVAERGFDVIDDGAPLLALRVHERARISVAELVDRLPENAGPFTETGYDVPDDVYRKIVSDVLDGEIAAGEGSNFVIHRAVTGRVARPPALAALGALRQLLIRERHAYWTFAVHTPGATFVGATPERHVSLEGGIARMNPISGTLRYPAGGYASAAERLGAALTFLDDAKERDELWMVLDEELKMMARIGDLGGHVDGPYLKEMAHLAHTEYVLSGRTSLDARDILAATMFAPTVTGSPIRNACRVIARHERRGRGYYGGVLALLDHDTNGRQRMDAPILIRTAQISPDGTVTIPAGATLVRGSAPEAELAETRAKAAAILGAFTGVQNVLGAPPSPPGGGNHGEGLGRAREDLGRDRGEFPGLAEDPLVVAALGVRNDTLAGFWLHERTAPVLPAGRITVIDAEDDFTAMLAHLLRSLGLEVTPLPWSAVPAAIIEGAEPVVLGPGPGDPADLSIERIAVLRRIAATRLAGGLPTLGICLGHQMLGLELGLEVVRLPEPDQGVQSLVRVAGQPQRAGFYNSFVVAPPAAGPSAVVPGLEVDTDEARTRIVAMRGPGFGGLQFHPESVLTTNGREILAHAISGLARDVAIQPLPVGR